MDLHQFRYTVALAEEANFSRAAKRLGVTQPSLSQQIKKLEDELGHRLFDRLPKRVVPTQAGEQLLVHARRVLSEIADARRRLGESSGKIAGALSIGAIPTIAPFLMPGLLRTFADRWPEVRLRVVEDVTARVLDLVDQGELDLAVVSTAAAVGTVHVESVATEPLHLMLPKRHPLARRKSVAWSAIADEKFLVLQEAHCLSGQVSRLCDKQRVRPPVVMHGSQLSTIAEMVSRGFGVSVVPAMMSRADRSPSRVFLPLSRQPPSREICVAWSLLRYRTAAARAFVDLLREATVVSGTGSHRRKRAVD